MPEVKSGRETSEHETAGKNSAVAILVMILGLLTSVGATVAASFGQDTKIGIIVGAVVAIAGVASKTLVSLGYIKSRTEVKAAKSLESVSKE